MDRRRQLALPGPPGLRCTRVVSDSGVVDMSVAGEIDFATVDQFRDSLRAALALPKVTRLRVDLHGLNFMDGGGAGVLSATHAAARRRGIELVVTRVHGAARLVLDTLGLSSRLVEKPEPSAASMGGCSSATE